jgi:II/X family phage/plasmid replication protein
LIDWITAELPLLHLPIQAGEICSVLPDGEIEWATPKRSTVRGSFESSIQVKSVGGDGQGNATHIWISGNPSKFLQGHNVFGSDDIVPLVLDTYMRILEFLEISPPIPDYQLVKQGIYSLSRVDINYSYQLPYRADVLSWIRAAEYKSKTRHGRPQMKGGTLYWGKTSKRWSLKVYSKGEELEVTGHRLPLQLEHTPLKKWADNKLRLELTLRSKELIELGLNEARNLDVITVNELFNSYLGRLEMNEQIALKTEEEMNLPQRLRSTYILWKNGEDLRMTLPKATFYRHRKAFLDYGIDITLRQDSPDKSNVIALIRVLEAKPASIPDWAFEEFLVHHSACA